MLKWLHIFFIKLTLENKNDYHKKSLRFLFKKRDHLNNEKKNVKNDPNPEN